MPLTRAERIDAKVANEQTKLLATATNNVAVATIIGGALSPVITTGHIDPVWGAFALGGATVLHLVARLILHDLRPED